MTSIQKPIDSYFGIRKCQTDSHAKNGKLIKSTFTKDRSKTIKQPKSNDSVEPGSFPGKRGIEDEPTQVLKHVKKLKFDDQSNGILKFLKPESSCEEPDASTKDETVSGNKSNSIKKKLSPQEIRDKLKQCGGMEDLKLCLSKINSCSKQLKEIRQKAKLKKFSEDSIDFQEFSTSRCQSEPVINKNVGSFDIESDTVSINDVKPKQLKKFENIDIFVTKSPSKLKSPIKSPAKSPAYQKFHSLASPVQSTLVLPYKFKFLLEVFRCCDTVVSMMFNRKEQISYSKLKSAVERMLRRNFSEVYLSQIITVFPTAYSFTHEKVRFKLSPEKSYQLIITPNLDNSRTENMTAKMLLQRRNHFHHSLLEILKGLHREYLNIAAPDLTISDDDIVRWHPGFLTEDIPDIEITPLPEPKEELHFNTASDILEHTRKYTEINPRLVEAVKKVVNINETKEPSHATPCNFNDNLKGISRKLLEKIREKEALKAKQEMLRDPVRDAEDLKKGRLPELARVTRAIFIAEKKSAILLSDFYSKLCQSFKEPLTKHEAEEHILLLLKYLPEFGKVHTIQKGRYLKIDKQFNITSISDRLKEEK